MAVTATAKMRKTGEIAAKKRKKYDNMNIGIPESDVLRQSLNGHSPHYFFYFLLFICLENRKVI